MTPAAQEAGLQYGPTASGKLYLSVYAHRGANPRKSCWEVSPEDEYGIFETADDKNRSDADGDYWGTRDADGTALGTRGERLAKFPHNGVPAVPWHGYPVSPASGRGSESPPDEFIDALIEEGAMSRTFGRKLQRRRA
jgi:hypothetical protein